MPGGGWGSRRRQKGGGERREKGKEKHDKIDGDLFNRARDPGIVSFESRLTSPHSREGGRGTKHSSSWLTCVHSIMTKGCCPFECGGGNPIQEVWAPPVCWRIGSKRAPFRSNSVVVAPRLASLDRDRGIISDLSSKRATPILHLSSSSFPYYPKIHILIWLYYVAGRYTYLVGRRIPADKIPEINQRLPSRNSLVVSHPLSPLY